MSITQPLEIAPERQGTHPANRGWFGPLPSTAELYGRPHERDEPEATASLARKARTRVVQGLRKSLQNADGDACNANRLASLAVDKVTANLAALANCIVLGGRNAAGFMDALGSTFIGRDDAVGKRGGEGCCDAGVHGVSPLFDDICIGPMVLEVKPENARNIIFLAHGIILWAGVCAAIARGW